MSWRTVVLAVKRRLHRYGSDELRRITRIFEPIALAALTNSANYGQCLGAIHSVNRLKPVSRRRARPVYTPRPYGLKAGRIESLGEESEGGPRAEKES